MYRTEAKAKRMLDPYAIYALCPYEEMWFREVFVPVELSNKALLTALLERDLSPKTKKLVEEALEQTSSSLEKIKIWAEKGVIPYEHAPPHLKKYYINKKVRRL
jgi:hypothetical protein